MAQRPAPTPSMLSLLLLLGWDGDGQTFIPPPWGGRQIELVMLSPLYSGIEANYCSKLYSSLPVSSAALLGPCTKAQRWCREVTKYWSSECSYIFKESLSARNWNMLIFQSHLFFVVTVKVEKKRLWRRGHAVHPPAPRQYRYNWYISDKCLYSCS